MPSPFISDSRRRRRWPLIAAVVVVLLGVGGWFLYDGVVKKPGDVTNPNAEFQDTTEQQPAPPATPPRTQRGETFVWAQYGYGQNRTRYLDAKLGPPFETLWRWRASKHLIEFPPVLANGVLYVVRNDGVAVALNARSGRVRWQRRVGALNASSPAYDNGRLYIATLEPGQITALRAKDGKVLWRKALSSRSESSPIVIKGRVLFGSESGTVYSMRADDGKVAWTYKAPGAVKAALAYADDKLYFGAYGGSVTALDLSGKKVWSRGTSGLALGRSGNFYSTPAVKYGRVYLGNTDGRVYSFVARDGQLAWTHSTGAYVYAAPSVARVPGTKPSVYIGSYDGNFYALDARNGREIWRHRAGGKISGSSTIVGDVVYFANLSEKSTSGLDVKTGKRVFYIKRGSFTPVISDGKRLYLTGYSSQYALVPKGSQEKTPRKPRRKPTRRKG
jgi:outer membrane protein assembly factor BamB